MGKCRIFCAKIRALFSLSLRGEGHVSAGKGSASEVKGKGGACLTLMSAKQGLVDAGAVLAGHEALVVVSAVVGCSSKPSGPTVTSEVLALLRKLSQGGAITLSVLWGWPECRAPGRMQRRRAGAASARAEEANKERLAS